MRLTPAERQARYRARHPEKVAAYRVANKKRQDAEYRARNEAKIKTRIAEWRTENAVRDKENKRRYYEENKQVFVAKAADWQKNNPDKTRVCRAAQCRKRTAQKLRAAPKWANAFFISEAYRLAALRSEMMGFKWHVDHIVPLRSRLVCGLHVESNLQVIPASANQAKSNRLWPDMP